MPPFLESCVEFASFLLRELAQPSTLVFHSNSLSLEKLFVICFLVTPELSEESIHECHRGCLFLQSPSLTVLARLLNIPF